MDETTYRELLESFAVRDEETGEIMQRRCLTIECELRADDMQNPRTVTGVAVNYGDKAAVYGWKESIRAGRAHAPDEGGQSHAATRPGAPGGAASSWKTGLTRSGFGRC